MQEGDEIIDQQFAIFLVEDYKLKADYLKVQFDRLWKRFQIFLVIEAFERAEWAHRYSTVAKRT